jgi:hypothetical protein
MAKKITLLCDWKWIRKNKRQRLEKLKELSKTVEEKAKEILFHLM